ncbi:hypothetical protein H0H93_008682 [Arthromyces matolae]|nr:hypothetical protein H0H93_008682 [Arthromyces matolae]
MAKGVTKTVHKFMINNNESESFVAKRFFNIGSGPVDNATNSRVLQQELIRLKQGQWFLTLFMESADEKGLDVCKDIRFSDGFLVREHGSCFDTLVDPAVWLIEPLRTTSVVKFSGTLCHPTRSDKIGKTITAFAHFVYEISQKSMVFADIQGSPMTINGGKAVTILFDLMTHTMDMSSGVGDHGKDSITSFVTQHVCDFFCRNLDLPSLQNTQEELDEA